jgi:hypothetical protein
MRLEEGDKGGGSYRKKGGRESPLGSVRMLNTKWS